MSNRKWPEKGRGRSARSRGRTDLILFHQALTGESSTSNRTFDPATDRKTLQLCRQVQRALMLALAGECGDELFRDLSVDSVSPAGSAGHLLVRIMVPPHQPVLDTVARLNERAGHLRSVLSASICRKRVPMLSFVAVPAGLGTESWGDYDD